MAKRKVLPQITPPDPAQIMMAGVAPVSIGERLGSLADQPMQPRRAPRPLDIAEPGPGAEEGTETVEDIPCGGEDVSDHCISYGNL